MVYEARWSRPIHVALAIAVLLLSILGFAAAGVIDTGSKPNPGVGWGIVAACAIVALVFLRRVFDQNVQARADQSGVYSRRLGSLVPWSEIERVYVIVSGIQRVARFERRGASTFGINTTFYDRGVAELLAAVRAHRPDLCP